jgi:hypothetical protein
VDPNTPAAKFVAEQEGAGTHLWYALINLLLSDVPLERDMRNWIALMMAMKAEIRGKSDFNRLQHQANSIRLQLRKQALTARHKAKGAKDAAMQAELDLAKEEGLRHDTLRTRMRVRNRRQS